MTGETVTGIRYSRRLTDAEQDVLSVAGEIIRTKWNSEVPDWLEAEMYDWAMRLRKAHDELLASLRLGRGGRQDDTDAERSGL